MIYQRNADIGSKRAYRQDDDDDDDESMNPWKRRNQGLNDRNTDFEQTPASSSYRSRQYRDSHSIDNAEHEYEKSRVPYQGPPGLNNFTSPQNSLSRSPPSMNYKVLTNFQMDRQIQLLLSLVIGLYHLKNTRFQRMLPIVPMLTNLGLQLGTSRFLRMTLQITAQKSHSRHLACIRLP